MEMSFEKLSIMPTAAVDTWEVVTKSRKQQNLEKKVNAHTEQKRIAALPAKLEELLPSHDLFGPSSSSSTNSIHNAKSHSPAKSSSSSKSRSPRKQNQEPSKKQSKTVAPPPPHSQPPAPPSVKSKSLEQTIREITPDDFAAQLAIAKISCPGSQLRWLSNIASYFNTTMNYECDPTFSGRSIQYPSILASGALKSAIVEFLSSVGETNREYFFYSLLDSMATELNNNQCVVGYKFMLQLIGQNWPNICSINMAKTALLRNSYQNRSSIGLSILWAIGQGGYQSLTVGVKVWQNIMLPSMELKNYTKYAVEYIERVANAAIARKSESLQLNQHEFFVTFNALNAPHVNLPKDLQQSLKRSAALVLEMYIASSTKHANIFLTLLREIVTSHKNRTEIEGCLQCLLISGDECFKIWRMNYKKQQLPSLILLQAIDKGWNLNTNQLVESRSFQNFLCETNLLNKELAAGKRKEGFVDDLKSALISVQDKTSAQQKKNKQNAAEKKKCGCCKWALGSILIIALIAGALWYDTEVNGKGVFEKSAVGKVLKNAGVLPHVQKGWYFTMSASARGYKWAEEKVPPYAQPAFKLTIDLYKLFRNAACQTCSALKSQFIAKWPSVAKFIDQYVPNLSGKLEAFGVATKDLLVNSYDKCVVLIKENVLIGRFSPENLNQALNATRNVALEYYNEFHKKVDAYAKLK